MDTSLANVTTQDAERKNAATASMSAASQQGQPKAQFPAGSVNYRIRPGGTERGFWVDIEIAGVDKSGQFTWSANVADPSTGKSLPIELSALVYEENLIVNPRSLDGSQVSLGTLKAAPIIAARLNVRKMIGSIHIKAVSSTLDFVKGNWQVLVDGSNYLVKAYIVSSPGVVPGKYEGSIRIDTDDPAHKQIEVPFKVTLVP